MTSIQSREFRGHSFRFVCVDGAQHPSWFSFDDESTVRDRDWTVEADDCVLDVGAAYGSYTLTALACGAAFVFAWSPSSPIIDADVGTECAFLRASLRLNDWQDRCVVYPTGFYDKNGRLNAMSQAFDADSTTSGPDIIDVQPMDTWYVHDFLTKHTKMSFRRYWLKLDVEGAEVAVLRGGAQLLAELQPFVLVENHQFKDATIADQVRRLMLSYGYSEISTHPYHGVSHSLYRPQPMVSTS